MRNNAQRASFAVFFGTSAAVVIAGVSVGAFLAYVELSQAQSAYSAPVWAQVERLLRTEPRGSGVATYQVEGAASGVGRFVLHAGYSADGERAVAAYLVRYPDFPLILVDLTPVGSCGLVWVNRRYLNLQTELLPAENPAAGWEISEAFACPEKQ